MIKKKLGKSKKNTEIQVIYGYHAVSAALQNRIRNHECLYIIQKYKDLFKQNPKISSKIKILSNKEMIKIFGNNNLTQGIVLKTSKLPKKIFKEVFNNNDLNKKKSIVVLLDQVTDPNNIGSIMRSCSLFNCSSLILSKDHAPDLTSAMIKSASGAAEIVNYIQVVNINRTINDLKKIGYWVIGLDSNSKNNNSKFSLPEKCVLVLGSEGKGIRNLTKKECDDLIALPFNPKTNYGIDSLNVSNACSIALYEHYIQHFKKT